MFHKAFHSLHNASLRQAETAALFTRAEYAEVLRIWWNVSPLRKAQNVSSRLKIAPTFDRLRHRRDVGWVGQR
ncbi:hypothetical protein CHX27_13015 [Flavobacterium aurantiibacter]|uniref:Uncharacterized protein n=1 Tax=Flavobacterium aurantiibacter TaxID=2023067 RepID=A0A255ZJ08_9FLAO|nr:hypothetical protein CHX27_13015 [Flavobacterium aurantiibacter]